MKASSLWPDVVDGLVDMLRAQAGFRAPAADTAPGDPLSDVLVLDSLEQDLTEDSAADLEIVVGDSTDGTESEAGWLQQEAATAGQRGRREVGIVNCQAVARTGSLGLPGPVTDLMPVTVRVLRRRAFDAVKAFEVALRANPTLSVLDVQSLVVEMAGERSPVRAYQTESRAVVAVTFRIRYRAQI
jgi:hypothetical protein